MEDKSLTPIGKFEMFEAEESNFFDKSKKRVRFAEPLGLTIAEGDFLKTSLDVNRFALVIVANKEKTVKAVITALYSTFRVVLAFTPCRPFSTSDFYNMIALRGTVEISPRALEVIKLQSRGVIDCTDRVDRLLNIDYFLARGTERQRCYHDMIDNTNSFAKSVAFLCGIDLTLEPKYPEPIFPARFDYALLGALIIEALSKSRERGFYKAHLGFLTHNGSEPFADIRLLGDILGREAVSTGIIERLNMPVKISTGERGTARILLSPIRPDFSVLELKQAIKLKPSKNYVSPIDDDKFPK